MRCDTCKFWTRHVGERDGYCRRYPQHLQKFEYDWCGEYAVVEDWLATHAAEVAE